MAEFTAGAKVKYRGMAEPAEIISGPHKTTYNRMRYLIRKADGNVSLVFTAELERIVPRLDQVAGTLAMHVYGRPFPTLDTPRRLSVAQAAAVVLRIADDRRGEY